MNIKSVLMGMAFVFMFCSAGFIKSGFETANVYAQNNDEIEAQVNQVITGETNIKYNSSENYKYCVKFVPKKTGEYKVSFNPEKTFNVEFKNSSFDNLGSSNFKGKKDCRFYVVAGKTYYMRFTSAETKDTSISVTYSSNKKPNLEPHLCFMKNYSDKDNIDYDEYTGKGIKWDPSTLTLEFNNFNEAYSNFDVYYVSKPDNYYFDGSDFFPNNGVVNIVIKGNNTLNISEGYYDGIAVEHGLHAKFCGNGVLNINYDVDDKNRMGYALAGYSDLIIDGPTINITSNALGFVILAGDDIVINSGTVNITQTNSTAILKSVSLGDFQMNGGNLNITCTKKYIEDRRTNPVIDVKYAYINGGKIDIKTNIESDVFGSQSGNSNNIYSLDKFVMKGGMLVFHALPSLRTKDVNGATYVTYSSLVYADTINISDGTIIIDYEKSTEYEYVYGWNPFIWESDFNLSNTQIFLTGDKSVINELNDKNNGKFKLYDMYNFYDDDLDREEWKKHTHVDKTVSVKEVSTLDISKYGISLLEGAIFDNGKFKEPKIDLKGLVSNKQVKINYAYDLKAGKGTATITGIAPFAGKVVLKFKITKIEPKIGTVLNAGKYIYKVVKSGNVAVIGLKKKNLKTIKIADKVTIDGFSYKVTSISSKAFKNNKNIKKVIIGKNVSTIGKKAFYGNKKLKEVVIKTTKLEKIGKKAFFRKGGKKIVFKVPKKKLKKYKKLLKKARLKKFIIK